MNVGQRTLIFFDRSFKTDYESKRGVKKAGNRLYQYDRG
jgi:hypothetical protein